MIIRHFDSQSSKQLLLNIGGRASTGKSFIIQVLSLHLERRTPYEVIIRCAPTGAASFGIKDSTLHALFKFPFKKKSYEPLSSANVATL